MITYDLEAADFALSVQGIHLLRSRFNYKTVPYTSIDKATIKRTREIRNPLLSIVFGSCLLVFAILQTRLIVDLFNDPNVHRIHVQSIILPLLPGLLGIYLIFIANKKGLVLILETGRKSRKLRLNDFVKNYSTKQLIDYLNNRLPNNLIVFKDQLDGSQK